jgi:hypothetical protein
VSGISAIRSASVRTAVTAVTVPVAAGSLGLVFASYAFASTGVGVATLALPGATAASPLPSGSSATAFTVALPAHAACAGDTAHDGYHVYSYLVPEGTDLSSVTFINFPSTGYGLVGPDHRYYGAVNTAIHSGEIIGIPNDFEWGPLVSTGGGSVPLSTLLDGSSRGVWETGIVCADARGTVTDAWNTQVTFAAHADDPEGFTWTAASGGAGALPTSPPGGANGPTAGGRSIAPVTGANGGVGRAITRGARTPGRVGSTRSSTGSGEHGSAGGDGSPGTAKAGAAPATDDAPIDAAVAVGALAVLAGLVLLVRRSRRAGRPGPVATDEGAR